MSAIALQRVVVRMMYDADFRQRVYANPERALRDVSLTPQERQWLVTPAPNAYGADAYRRGRALSGLLEEFPVASALAVRQPRGLQRLQQFFASPAFHQCVQTRGSLAAAFGKYLVSATFRSRQTPSEMAHIAAVETAIAQVRRAPPPLSAAMAPITSETPIGLAPWVVLLTVHPDTLECYRTLLAFLQQYRGDLVEAVLDTRYRHTPRAPALRGVATAYVLVSFIPGSDGPSLESVNDDLGELLKAASTPRSMAAWYRLVESMDCDPQEAQEVIEGLVDDRILHPWR